jgi:hypothetical protein
MLRSKTNNNLYNKEVKIMVLSIGGKLYSPELGKYESIGRLMLKLSKEILVKEGFSNVPVQLGLDTYNTCGGRSYVQYGSQMILGQINDAIVQAERYYFVFKVPDTQQLIMISISGFDKCKLGCTTKLASTMLEEIGHVVASGINGHNEVFYTAFTRLWEKYFDYLRTELNRTLSIIEMASR